jgi:diguanylate cyclase (GGDEF)-like protein/PAS domain S-box-containing protein
MASERAPLPRSHTQRAEIARLRRLAWRDELTGLANRRAFLERLEAEMARSLGAGTPFTLVLLDLDGLKDLNDTFGHHTGDAALRAFARALRRAVRADDLVARIGGDEFAVIGVHVAPADAAPFAARIHRVAEGLTRRILPGRQRAHLTAAMGVATWDGTVGDVGQLFARAEAALLSAKTADEPAEPVASGVYRPRGRRTLGEELRRLLAMARRVSSSRELEELCRAAAENAAALIEARDASIALPRPDGCTGYEERFSEGRWLRVSGCWYRPGQGLIGRVMETAQPYVTADARGDDQVDQEAVARFDLRSIMCLPLRDHSGRAMGVLSLSNKRDNRPFTDNDVRLGMAFADLVATAIENVRAREEAEAAHSYLRSLMDQAHDAIYITDPYTRRILDANEAAERLSGYTRAQLLSMRAPDLRPPEDRAAPGTTDLVLEHGARSLLVTVPRHHLRADGRIVPVEVSARLVQTPRGPVVMNIVRDVSERVAAEEELRRRHRELEARNDVSHLLAQAENDPAALERVLRIAVHAAGGDGGIMLAEYDPEAGGARVTVEYQVPEPLRSYLLQKAHRPGGGFLGAALTGNMVHVPDTQASGAGVRPEALAAGVRAFACVPLAASGRVLGVLGVGSFTAHRFGEQEIALLRAVADQTAVWLERQRLLEETRRREQEARFLAELSALLNEARTADTAARRLAAKASEALGRAVVVFLFDAPSRQWQVVATYHPIPALRRRLARMLTAQPPREAGELMAGVSAAGRAELVDVRSSALPLGAAEKLAQMGITAVVVAPLHVSGRLVGMLAAGNGADEPPMMPHQVRLAEEIARHAAAVLANALSRHYLLARNRELRLINDIAVLAQRVTDAHALDAAVVERLRRYFRAQSAVLRRWDAAVGVLRFAAGSRLPAHVEAWSRQTSPALGAGITGRVAATRRPAIIEDALTDPRPLYIPEVAAVLRSSVYAPLVVGDELIGTLSVHSNRPRAFSEAHARIVMTVARQVAPALARTALAGDDQRPK